MCLQEILWKYARTVCPHSRWPEILHHNVTQGYVKRLQEHYYHDL